MSVRDLRQEARASIPDGAGAYEIPVSCIGGPVVRWFGGITNWHANAKARRWIARNARREAMLARQSPRALERWIRQHADRDAERAL